MLDERQQSKPELYRQFTRKGEREFRSFAGILEQSAARIREGLSSVASSYAHYFDALYPEAKSDWYGFYEPNVYVTDHPEEIFPKGPVYSVTSSMALMNLENGTPILPTKLHSKYGVISHRGFANQFAKQLLVALDIDVGSVSRFVFAGPQIDAEQIRLERDIGQLGPRSDRSLIEAVYTESHALYGDGYHYELRPEFLKLLTLIRQGHKPADDPQSVAYLNYLMQIIHRTAGLREGWYSAVKNKLLSGNVDVRRMLAIEDLLLLAIDRHTDPRNKVHILESETVVLEIDPEVLYSHQVLSKAYPFVVAKRHPSSILMAPYFDKSCVRKVYARDSQRIRHITTLPTSSFDDIPSSAFISGIRPEDVESIDPEAPLCLVRYGESPQDTWFRHATNGKIAPFHDIECDRPQVPHSFANVFGKQVFGYTDGISIDPTVCLNRLEFELSGVVPGVYSGTLSFLRRLRSTSFTS